MKRALLLLSMSLTGCAASSNIGMIRTDDATPRSAVDADHVQIMAASDLEGCIPLGRIGVMAGRPDSGRPMNYDGVRTLRNIAAELGADEVRDLRFEDVADDATAAYGTAITGLACARAPGK